MMCNMKKLDSKAMITKCLGKIIVSSLLATLWGGLVLLSGCEEPPPPPPPEKIEITTPPPATAESEENQGEPEQEKPPAYEYNPSGRREPFKTLIVEQIPEVPEILVTPDPDIIKTPLQKFDVKQLKVTGIILGGLGEYARVAAPDGKSYTLLVGTLVGPHDGEVISITDNVVVVKEIYRYESGKVEEVETPLYLKPIEEEEKS